MESWNKIIDEYIANQIKVEEDLLELSKNISSDIIKKFCKDVKSDEIKLFIAIQVSFIVYKRVHEEYNKMLKEIEAKKNNGGK